MQCIAFKHLMLFRDKVIIYIYISGHTSAGYTHFHKYALGYVKCMLDKISHGFYQNSHLIFSIIKVAIYMASRGSCFHLIDWDIILDINDVIIFVKRLSEIAEKETRFTHHFLLCACHIIKVQDYKSISYYSSDVVSKLTAV